MCTYRGHEVLVVGASAHMQFFKQAAARHSSNSSAEALRYLEVDLAAAAKQAIPGRKQVKPGQVTQSRFAGETSRGMGVLKLYLLAPIVLVNATLAARKRVHVDPPPQAHTQSVLLDQVLGLLHWEILW
jgi:hypothetical protein